MNTKYMILGFFVAVLASQIVAMSQDNHQSGAIAGSNHTHQQSASRKQKEGFDLKKYSGANVQTDLSCMSSMLTSEPDTQGLQNDSSTCSKNKSSKSQNGESQNHSTLNPGGKVKINPHYFYVHQYYAHRQELQNKHGN